MPSKRGLSGGIQTISPGSKCQQIKKNNVTGLYGIGKGVILSSRSSLGKLIQGRIPTTAGGLSRRNRSATLAKKECLARKGENPSRAEKKARDPKRKPLLPKGVAHLSNRQRRLVKGGSKRKARLSERQGRGGTR